MFIVYSIAGCGVGSEDRATEGGGTITNVED